MEGITEPRLCSYPKIYAMGHPQLRDLLADEVIVEEKVDGSQISFGVLDGELMVRSKGKQLLLDAPEKMFNKAVAEIREMAPNLKPNMIYRGEYLQSPKHNTLCYDRHPEHHIILFDVDDGMQTFVRYEDKKAEAERIGLECVPLLYQGKLDSLEVFNELLEKESILGGTKIEGVVVKNYMRFGRDGKVLLGKYVSEAFKEKHDKEWKKGNPNGKDVVQMLIEELRSEARWVKAVQHMREAGDLTESPKDIGKLINEVKKDILEEEVEHIKERLYKWAQGQILRGATAGLPQWYKERLAAAQFDQDSTEEVTK